jgi:hypothetical protein
LIQSALRLLLLKLTSLTNGAKSLALKVLECMLRWKF